VSDLYTPAHAHSTSPNLPLTEVKWEHPLSHNPFPAHPMYPPNPTNLMPISPINQTSHAMTPPTSMVTSGSPNMTAAETTISSANGGTLSGNVPPNNSNMGAGTTTLQTLESQGGGSVEFKDGNDNIHHGVSASPGTGHGYANMPPTPTSMTMLGPNSGKLG